MGKTLYLPENQCMKIIISSFCFLAVAFAGMTSDLTNDKQKSILVEEQVTDHSAYETMMKVLTHKRCVNCHPAGDRPRQGEGSHIHNFNVQRGPDNHGVDGLKCATCHQEENNIYSGVPGAPDWSLAPIEMRWEGLTKSQIAKSILDRSINGNRSIEETVKHLTEHELVLWAWEPGVNANGEAREPAPVPLDEYIAAVKEWAANGAVVPED